ncbi:MAG: AGE family epimerase/isomerase [Candidatus Omnitrophica bacterium]|nr:AGE family epimerase/isomerase [Candidatus Omnitrophota bacterium]
MLSRRSFLTCLGAASMAAPLVRIQASSAAAQSAFSDWPDVSELLQRILHKNILSFWHPNTVDLERKVYQLNHDIQGKYKGESNKRLVVQARCVWFYSHLFRKGFGSKEHLDAAQIGFEFLRDHLWDQQYGGFYWEIDAAGEAATMPDKHLYGQSFGLYALSEYYLASGDREALALARKLFSILEYFAYDPAYGGYIESFRREWTQPPEKERSYMSAPHNIKLMNTHLHLMEAFTTFYNACKDQTVRERLIELIRIQSNSVLRKNVGACTDRYERDWTPLRGPDYDRVSYGHDLENIWLLMDACSAVGSPDGPLMDLFTELFAYSLQYGFDAEQGGFYNSGPFNGMADRRGKDWWVQAEALVSALRMYQKTGEDLYRTCFHKMLDWINRHQIDWRRGEWFALVRENGQGAGDKAGPWKSPYHNGRAMMECIQIIQELS